MSKNEILFLVFSYLIGAIPVGFILYYLTDRKDIRKEGSGNIGATNVMRLKGKIAGLVTLALDMSKGFIPIFYGLQHFDSPVIVISGGAAAIIGHLFPVYLKFKGGKGIATFLGICVAFYFPSALVFGAAFLVTCSFTRFVSASSVAGAIAVFFTILFTQVMEVSMVMLVIVVLIILKHHCNFRRLTAGTEPRMQWKKNE